MQDLADIELGCTNPVGVAKRTTFANRENPHCVSMRYLTAEKLANLLISRRFFTLR